MVRDFYALHDFRKTSGDDEGNTVWELVLDDYNEKNKYIQLEADYD